MKTQTFKRSVISAAMLAAYGPVFADDAELAQLTKPDSSVSVGIGGWSGDRPQQGIYDGMRDKGAYGLLDIDLIKRDEATGTWLTLNARDLGLDTRSLKGEWLRQGDIGASIEYSRTPRNNPLTIITGLQGIGTSNLTISGAGAANILPQREVQLGTNRELLELGVYKNLVPGLDFKIDFKSEDKDGTRHWGLGSQPLFMVEPINSTTRQFEGTLRYSTEKLQVEGGYHGSWYENAHSLILGTIKGAAVGTISTPGTTPLSQPLDNQAHQLYVNGGYTFTPTTRGTFKVSYGRATQNESLPIWNTTIANTRFNAAPSSLNGRVDTTLVEMGISSRPTSKFSVTGKLRYHNMDDKTPVAGFIGNNATGAITVHNTPHSIKTVSGKLEGTYRLGQGLSLLGGVDRQRQDRSYPLFQAERYVPFRSKVDEDTYRIQLRRSMSETVNGSIALLHSKRDGSAYLATEHFPSDYINPIHIANRERDKVRLSLDWAPTERFSIQGALEDALDKYGNNAGRPLGLRDGKASLYSLDANYVVSDNWHLTGWYSHDATKARMLGARWDRVSENYEVDKDIHLKDRGDSLGLGLRGKISGKVTFGADLQRTRNTSDYDHSTSTNGPAGLLPDGAAAGSTAGTTAVNLPPPQIVTNLTRLKLFAGYALDKHSDLRLDVVHERWTSNDWSWQFAGGTPFIYGGTTDGTQVISKPKESTNFIGVRYMYKFQ